nr:gliding motility-associated C-terminal domain-containing protein [Bacteroidota bacterium]
TSTDAICYSYCDGTAQATVSGGNIPSGDFSYSWTTGTGSNTASITDLCAGESILTVTDDNGCEATRSIEITEPVLLEIDTIISLPVTCSGDCDGQMEIYDAEAVEYSFNDGASWIIDPILQDQCEGIYALRIRDAIGCIGTGGITVTGPPPVEADFEWGPEHVNVDHPLVQFHNTSENADTYDWDIIGLLQTTDEDLQFMFDNHDPAFYEVCMIAYNYNLCSDTICKMVEIEDVLLTYVPNTFTPNSDDLNDGFKMSTNIDVITDFSMIIFDRWGQQIFQTTDPYDAWNGGHGNSGDILKSDVYAYRITFEIKETQTRKEYMGHVTLLK